MQLINTNQTIINSGLYGWIKFQIYFVGCYKSDIYYYREFLLHLALWTLINSFKSIYLILIWWYEDIEKNKE